MSDFSLTVGGLGFILWGALLTGVHINPSDDEYGLPLWGFPLIAIGVCMVFAGTTGVGL